MGIDNAEYRALRRWLAYTALRGRDSTNLASSYFSAYELSRMMLISTFLPWCPTIMKIIIVSQAAGYVHKPQNSEPVANDIT